MSGDTAGIVLAAGEGRRFGGPKALARLSDVPLVERAVSVLREGGCRPVVVVLGAGADDVVRECDLSGAEVVLNEAWPSGLASSLFVGLEAAERADARGAIVLHVDQPLVTPALVARLIAAWRAEGKSVLATFGGEAVSPALIDRGRWAEVRSSVDGDRGAKKILQRDPSLVTLVDCDDVGDPRDVDSPEDLE
ncbi:MAG: nucleotidyltransferase family protein, partial [Acidimicrobiales bacterium]